MGRHQSRPSPGQRYHAHHLRQSRISGAGCFPGAAGYLSKETDPHRIPRAVRAAAEGDSLLDRSLLRAALQDVSSSPLPTVEPEPVALPAEELTEQETVVLKLIVEGFNNEAIADTLSISRSTVKTHVSHIFRKLNVSDRTQAAVWAMRHGLAN
ncbi:MAG TPA: response regulator transcription factor [Anaerolineae bacterium]|nr:response regulator transcription factor [Anaerolineae bacterium]